MPALNQQLKTLILISALVVLTGILILVVLLSSEDPGALQIALIGLILLLWPVGVLINYYRRKRRAQATEGTEASGADAAPAVTAPSQTYPELINGAEEAVQYLRQSSAPAGGDAAYGLPWFLVAGPPGSGKTSLLLSSGLSFNALSSQRRSDQNLLRPTGGAEWRVSDQAVFIDTAGHYQAEGAGRDEWLGLIDTLKRHRKDRPLDGLIVTINASNILSANEAELNQQADILRARLNDLTASSGVRFPVYLVFNQMDALPGFRDFFQGFGTEERAQVWGTTFPLADAEKAPALFDVEFDYLLESLMRRRLLHLSAPAAAKEQLGIFDFPSHFSAARRKLGAFTIALFKSSQFSKTPLLRGVYFTSGQAEQTAGQAGETRVVGRGFFTADFFNQVLMRDKDLAASFQSVQAAPNRLRKVMLAAVAAGALCLLLFVGLLISFINNYGLISEARQAGGAVLAHVAGGAKEGATLAEMNDLEAARSLIEKINGVEGSWIGSLFYRLGLYSGRPVAERMREIYYDFVSQRFLNPAISALGQDLDQLAPGANAGDVKKSETEQKTYYNKLKAYLALETQQHAEPASLMAELAPYWKEPDSRKHLQFFTAEASLRDDAEPGIPRLKADPARVAKAREKLKGYSEKRRVYEQVMDEINGQGTPYGLKEIMKGSAASGWIDESNVYSVPYAYTKPAYYQHVLGGALSSVKEKLKEDWVMGTATDLRNVTLNDLENLYYAEYAAEWQNFLRSLSVRKFENNRRAVEVLQKFEDENSPLKAIIVEVAKQAKLTEVTATDGIVNWAKAKMSSRIGTEARKVEQPFDPLIRFADKGINEYLVKLGAVRKRLAEKSREKDAREWSQLTSLKTDQDFRKTIDDARDALKPLAAVPGAMDFLESPLRNIEEGLQIAIAKDTDKAWSDLLAKARRLEAGYPFNRSSEAQVSVAELTQVLGELNKFYEDNLKNSLDGSPGQFTTRESQKCSAECAKYLNQMFKLRAALFTQGPQQPKFDYQVTLQPLAGRAVEVLMDGATLKAGGKPDLQNASWPAASNPGVKATVTPDGQPPQQLNGFPGTWGVFKLLGARSGGAPYKVTFEGVSVTIQPPTINNPFEIDFNSIRAPQTVKGI